MAGLGKLRAPIVGIVLLAIAPLVWARIALNLDVTQASIANTICVPGYTKSVRPSTAYTNGVKLKLLRESRIDGSRKGLYARSQLASIALPVLDVWHCLSGTSMEALANYLTGTGSAR